MANTVFTIIIIILTLDYLLERYLDFLNSRARTHSIPQELSGIYEQDRYVKSQEYEKVNQQFSLITSSISFLLTICLLVFGVFGYLDNLVRGISENAVIMALLFFGIFGFIADVFSTPFSLYKTFVIEERFGFNKTTVKTFILDKLKTWMLGLFIGGGLISLIVWIYANTGSYFWIIAWLALSVFSVFITMFYTSLIVPLFNKLQALGDGELKTEIEAFAQKTGFAISGIQVMDGSKRSQKANAYFSGLGPRKRIVLFDTLIKDHPKEELIAILAHEIGHYKKKHTITGMLISFAESAVMLFILGIFIGHPALSMALGAKVVSFHMGVLAFGLLYSPVSMALGLLTNYVSRKNEYQADRFAGENYNPEALQTALKNLSANHLSNLTPHPAYVFFYYSHPTLLQRVKMLNTIPGLNTKKS